MQDGNAGIRSDGQYTYNTDHSLPCSITSLPPCLHLMSISLPFDFELISVAKYHTTVVWQIPTKSHTRDHHKFIS